MSDTDSQMMRRQQALDVPEHIDEDETEGRHDRSDSDGRSRADREAALRGEATQANEQMDAVFAENGGGTGRGKAEADMLSDAATDGKASLAHPGRSLLGD
ncbi:hypothetical protein [Mangrovicella endophytica]|uniref:hypothetical protein n=1 Tax=Mangrovicella endophytica TaxID=2066697 RepID=UPI000C9DF8EF|nr:hypothetical protein [Mangrovicella endophytica]